MKRTETCNCNIIHQNVVAHVTEEMISQETISDISSLFKILGDPTRVKIVWALEQHELCVCDIAAVLNMTKSAISHQLALLRKNNIVKTRREGKQVFYSLDDEHVTCIIEMAKTHVCHSHSSTQQE
ncbi:MAG: metalloregulator ArsR/SmtB family transcription factor [Eubacteriales bacterium]